MEIELSTLLVCTQTIYGRVHSRRCIMKVHFTKASASAEYKHAVCSDVQHASTTVGIR